MNSSYLPQLGKTSGQNPVQEKTYHADVRRSDTGNTDETIILPLLQADSHYRELKREEDVGAAGE